MRFYVSLVYGIFDGMAMTLDRFHCITVRT